MMKGMSEVDLNMKMPFELTIEPVASDLKVQ